MAERSEIKFSNSGGAPSGRRINFVPGVVLSICLILTAVSSTVFFFGARARDEARYSSRVALIRNGIQSQLALHLGLLRATKGFMDTDEHAERVRFTNFVLGLGHELEGSGIQGIGYTHVFRGSERDALIARMKAEGVPEFLPYPESDREVRQAIIYLVPQDKRNRTAIGYDMSSEETRRAAIERARDRGEPAMSGRVTLVQEITENKQAGFLIYLPIYRDGRTPESIEGRRQDIKGFVYAPFRAGDFFGEVEESLRFDDIGFEVYDGDPSAANLLSHSMPEISRNYGSWARFRSSDEMEAAGRKWTVLYASTDAFAEHSIVWWTPFIVVFGLILSGVLFVLTKRQGQSREKIRRTVNELMASEADRQQLFEKEKDAREMAESANVAKDEFLSVVSHELRTPLNAMAGWTRVLRASGLSQEMKDAALDKIERNLRLQSLLIEDILTFSQMDSSGLVIDSEQVDLTAVVGSVVSELEPAAVEKGITIEFLQTGGVVLIPGDGEKLRIAVLKLTDNAVKFTEAGGTVAISLEEDGKSARIAIRDSGVGIRPEFLPFVFDKFKQNDSSTTRRFGGLGLGLAICSQIVKTHGGSVSAYSEGEGKGSEFVITLPK